jgi:hypothetical protein
MKKEITWGYIEGWRDRVHRRKPGLAVGTKAQALKFVNDVGFCFAFKSDHSELPCLWHAACGMRNPVMPEHTHHDPYISFVWEMKEVLPSERKIYYGKLLKRRPTMVSLEYLPFFYVLSGRTGTKDEYRQQHSRGKLSSLAREIMDALMDVSPQATKGLKLSTGMTGKRDRAQFDKAISELQEKMYIVKVREDHDPFTFVWAPLSGGFSAQLRKARRITPEAARVQILERYFRNQLVGSVTTVHRLFRWSKQDIFRTLGQLVQRGTITANIKIQDEANRFYSLVKKG